MKDKELTILTKSPWYTIDRLFEESKYLLKQKINTKKINFLTMVVIMLLLRV